MADRLILAGRIGRLWKFKLTEVDEWIRVGGAKRSDCAFFLRCPCRSVAPRRPIWARFLAARGIKFVTRDDGTIALRQEELDRHTLTKPPEITRRRALDLSLLRRTG